MNECVRIKQENDNTHPPFRTLLLKMNLRLGLDPNSLSPPFAAAAPTAHILKQSDLIFCQLPRSSFPSNSERVTKFKVKLFSETEDMKRLQN